MTRPVNEEGLPAIAQVATDGSHVLIYVKNPTLTLMLNPHKFAHPVDNGSGTLVLRVPLTCPESVDEAVALTRIAYTEFNGEN